MIIIALNVMLSGGHFSFTLLLLLQLVIDECFMASRLLVHGLDSVMGASYSHRTAFKQTDVVIMAGRGL